jgi:dihydrofolate reductase
VSAPEPQVILAMSVSFDGFVARPDGVIDWGADAGARDLGADRHRANLELLGQVGTIVIGRGAYEDMVRGWPGTESPMGVLMNTLPKVVFSRTLSEVTWNAARISRAPLEEEIPALRRAEDRDVVVFGGARIAHSLIRHRLIDEYRLTVHPVALGAGLPLMHGLPEPQRLEPISSKAYADGCVTQVLRPA